jgi:hypothetical protein
MSKWADAARMDEHRHAGSLTLANRPVAREGVSRVGYVLWPADHTSTKHPREDRPFDHPPRVAASGLLTSTGGKESPRGGHLT